MKNYDTRLTALEQNTRTHAALSVRRWLHNLTDYDLALVTATVSDLDAEIFVLLLSTTEAEVAYAVHEMGHSEREKH